MSSKKSLATPERVTITRKTVFITQLRPHPKNYRVHPPEQIAKLRASYRRLGQFRSLVAIADSDHPGDYTVVAGHGCTEAWGQEGAITVEIDELPPDTPAETVEAIMLADNLHSQGAEDDEAAMAHLLQIQKDAGFDLASLGSDEETLRQMLESLGNDVLASGDEDYTEGDEEDVAADPMVFSHEMIATQAYKYFRNTGFPYRKLPLYMCMQEINKLANLDDDKRLHSNLGYHVADTYHPHRFHSSAEHMWSPYEAFHDEKRLNKTFQLYLGELGNGVIPLDILGNLCVVSTTQACANFRPSFAMHLYRKYCNLGAVVLDTSTGYGGRLVGFMASGLAGKYIGIDPNTETHNANLRMATDLCFADSVELYNLPAEDVPHEQVANRCDFAFTSPPYFAKEHYSDEDTQSWKRYKTGEAWREGFLQKMLALQFVALKPGATAIINIADVQLRGKWYPLAQWAVEDGKVVGFEHVETQEFTLSRRFGEGHTEEVSTEPVIVFRKPGQSAQLLERVEVAHV